MRKIKSYPAFLYIVIYDKCIVCVTAITSKNHQHELLPNSIFQEFQLKNYPNFFSSHMTSATTSIFYFQVRPKKHRGWIQLKTIYKSVAPRNPIMQMSKLVLIGARYWFLICKQMPSFVFKRTNEFKAVMENFVFSLLSF